MADPILKLDLLVERHTVEINGVPYEFQSLEELSVLQTKRIEKRAGEVAELLGQNPEDDATSERMDRELAEALNYIVRAVLPTLPPEIFSKLSVNKKLAIATAFSGLLLTALEAGAPVTPAPEAAATTSTGER